MHIYHADPALLALFEDTDEPSLEDLMEYLLSDDEIEDLLSNILSTDPN